MAKWILAPIEFENAMRKVSGSIRPVQGIMEYQAEQSPRNIERRQR